MSVYVNMSGRHKDGLCTYSVIIRDALHTTQETDTSYLTCVAPSF